MNRTRFALFLAPLLLAQGLAACRSEGSAVQKPVAAQGSETSDAGAVTVHRLGDGPTTGKQSQGVPHSNNIDLVAISRDGAMAMSRDNLGGLRLWPSLDGTSEPLLVPIRGARAMSLDKGKESVTMAVIDSVGSLHILDARDGSVTELHMSSPHLPILQAEVLPGGEEILVLSRDHRLSVVDRQGRELSSVQKRRFRPQAIRLDSTGIAGIIMSSEPDARGHALNIQRFQMDPTSKKLTISDDELSVDGVMDLDPKRLALSPDGKTLAFLGLPAPKVAEEPPAVGSGAAGAVGGPALNRAPRPSRLPPPNLGNANQRQLLVHDLGKGETRTVDLSLPAHEIMQVGLGFVAENTIIISSRPSGGTWRIEVGNEIETFSLPASVANDTQRSAHAFAPGVHLGADGNWLFVQEPLVERHHYLGYNHFDPQYSSISPNGEEVAWTNTSMLFVESTSGQGDSIRIESPAMMSYFRASFISDELLAAIDYSGGLHLIDWKEGKPVGSLDTGGAVRDFEVDQERGLIRGVRQNGGSWVTELHGKNFGGLYLVQDQGFRSGFLGGDKALWSIDAQGKMHEYDLESLRKGLSSKEIKEGAQDLPNGAPMEMGRDGTSYFLHHANNVQLKMVKDGDHANARFIDLPFSPMQVRAAPGKNRVALLSSNAGTVVVYDTVSGESLWSMSFLQGVHHMEWSVDSSTLAVASQVGAVTLDAETGKKQRQNCGPWFEARKTPPASTVTFSQVQNICER